MIIIRNEKQKNSLIRKLVLKRKSQGNVTWNFKEIWEPKFVVIQVSEGTACLLWKKGFSDNRADSLKNHFPNMHIEFDNKFPVDGRSRVSEISRLKSQFHDHKDSLKQFLSSNELVTLASYKVAWILVQKKKPFSDVEMIRKLWSRWWKLLEKYDWKVKNDILQKVQNLQLSRRTVVRRVLELSKIVEEQLIEQFPGAGRVNRSYWHGAIQLLGSVCAPRSQNSWRDPCVVERVELM